MSEALDARVAARRQAEMVASLRRLSRPGGTGRRRRRATGLERRCRGESTATSAASRSTPTTATCSTWSIAASSAPARAASRCAAATPSCARPERAPCGSTTSTSPTRPGPSFGDPDRARVLHRLERLAAASSPSTRAPPARPSPSSTTEAWRDLRTANPVLMSLEPDAEALIVNRIADPPAVRDRADRRVLPAGRADQGRAGTGSRAARGWSGRSPRSSRSCASGPRAPDLRGSAA